MPRILIAEDDPAVRRFVARALSHRGHEVVAVVDGVAALEALSEGAYDLLLTDIVMPGIDGIALALKAARDHPGMPILMMSGFSAERQKAHNLEELIHRVIPKPFTLAEICRVVDETLDQHRPKPSKPKP